MMMLPPKTQPPDEEAPWERAELFNLTSMCPDEKFHDVWFPCELLGGVSVVAVGAADMAAIDIIGRPSRRGEASPSPPVRRKRERRWVGWAVSLRAGCEGGAKGSATRLKMKNSR